MNKPHIFLSRQRGLSLIELMISLTLSLAVMAGLASVYVAVKQTFRFQENTGRLQEDAVFALDSISRDLRMAGYAGCMGIEKGVAYLPGSVLSSSSPAAFNGLNPLAQIATIQAETTYPEVNAQPFTAYNFIRGFDATVPTGMVATSNPTPSAASGSLFFAGGSMKSVSLSAAMASPSASPTYATDTYSWATAAVNSGIYDFIISNCTASSLFKGKVTLAAGVPTIDHSTAMGNSSANFASNTMFGTDAVVTPAEWHYYFVATRTGANTPSLYHVYFNGNSRQAAEELVSNVESIKLHFGENTGSMVNPATGLTVIDPFTGLAVPSLVPDVWRTSAASVTDWSRVVAVRIGLMMVSAEDNINPGVTMNTPTLLGATYSLPTGASANRQRKEFSTTVVLRNRIAAR